MHLPKAVAIKIRDHRLDDLKRELPKINRMSLLPSGSGSGYYLEIGICETTVEEAKQALQRVLVEGELPAREVAPDRLTVEIVTTRKMVFTTGGTSAEDTKPVRGGHRVARESGVLGTLGCFVRLRRGRNGEVLNSGKFFLSCHHVLGSVPLGWQLELRDTVGGFRKRLGGLYWSKLNHDFDVAIGLVDHPEAEVGEGFARSAIRACEPRPGIAVDGQKVLVCGQTSDKSPKLGTVIDTNTHVWFSDEGGVSERMFRDQIRTNSICKDGDSGAILFACPDSSPSCIPIGMAFLNDPCLGDDDQGSTYYNNLQTLFAKQFDGPTWLGDDWFQLDSIIVEEGPEHDPAEPKK